MGNERIKHRILIPLTIAIVGLMGAFMSGSYRLLHGALNDEVNRYLLSVKKTLRARHHNDVETLSRTAESLKHNRTVQNAFLNEDRHELLSVLRPFYRELFDFHNITRISIYDANGVNFVRVHEPGSFGDVANHTTFNKARESAQPFFGMELAGSGAFTLSIVVPWKIKNQLAGYIEVEKELRFITADVPVAMGVELVSLIDKRYISREAWERTYLKKNSTSSWDDFKHFVIIDNSLPDPPLAVEQVLSTRHDTHLGVNPQVELDDRTYSIAFFPLIDVTNHDVGDIAVFYDSTVPVKRTQNLLLFICVMCSMIGIALFVSFYKMLDSLETELSGSREKLIEENRLRLEIEQKHAKELAAHVVELELARARERTMAEQIAKTNEFTESKN